jgi:hypothetical protein
MDVTRTIPQREDPAWVAEFFDGTRSGKEDFPFAQRIQRVEPGDFLYLVHRGRIRGRLEIIEVEQTQRTVRVGRDRALVRARTILWVQCPGESAGQRDIRRASHRGHRYDRVPEWDSRPRRRSNHDRNLHHR